MRKWSESIVQSWDLASMERIEDAPDDGKAMDETWIEDGCTDRTDHVIHSNRMDPGTWNYFISLSTLLWKYTGRQIPIPIASRKQV